MTEVLAGSRYRIERTLGRGGMATVYLAHDKELQRPVAVKVLAEHLGDEETFRLRFLREARLAGRLSHPNVVEVYDAGETDGRPFIVMEYVPGRTLADCGRISPQRVGSSIMNAVAPQARATPAKSIGCSSQTYSGLPRNTICSHLIWPSVLFLITITLMGSRYFTAVANSPISIDMPPSPINATHCRAGCAICAAIV